MRQLIRHLARPAAAALAAALAVLAGCGRPDAAAPAGPATSAPLKIGFVVKQPEVPWFQLEWKFAGQAAAEFGFELIRIGAADGEKVLGAIDNLAAVGAQGLVLCTPDVRLGPAIVARARARGLKLMAVDDRFVNADGTYMEDVHYLGISARKIGEMVGAALHAEMQARGWPVAETGVCVVTFDELDTARDRTEGAVDALRAAGFPADRIHRAPQKSSDVPGALDATNVLLTQHPGVKRWLVCGMNDSAVLGAVRATEGRGFTAADVIGIGINGTDCIPEFEKSRPTGFHASVLLSARQHGYETARMVHDWIRHGREPPLDTRTTGVLITRATFAQVLQEQGIRE